MIPRHKSSEFFAFFGVFERYADCRPGDSRGWRTAARAATRFCQCSAFSSSAVLLTFVDVDEGRRAAKV